MKVIRQVKRVKAHRHQDELFARFVALCGGRGAFPGIETARVEFSKKVVPKSPAQWAAEETLCIGGGGDILDEHRNGDIARLEGASASSLMMDLLGITDRALAAMAVEVTYFDNERRCPKAHLASLIKMIGNNLSAIDERKLVLLTSKVYAAVHARITGCLAKAPDELPFRHIVTQILRQRITDKGLYADKDARRGLINTLRKANFANRAWLFGLRYVYESLWRSAYAAQPPEAHPTAQMKRRGEIERDLSFFLDILYRDQVNYHHCLREFGVVVMERDADKRIAEGKKPRKFRILRDAIRFDIPIRKNGSIRTIAGAIVESDNPQAHNALRSCGAIISIVRNSAGNVSVQGNQDTAERDGIMEILDEGIRSLGAMCRHGDTPQELRNKIDWAKFCMRGKCPEEPYWYIDAKGRLALYNSTDNHYAPPTKLSLMEIVAFAKQAFDPELVEQWKRDRRVPQRDALAAAKSKHHKPVIINRVAPALLAALEAQNHRNQ